MSHCVAGLGDVQIGPKKIFPEIPHILGFCFCKFSILQSDSGLHRTRLTLANTVIEEESSEAVLTGTLSDNIDKTKKCLKNRVQS
jgi:hypothetical protein